MIGIPRIIDPSLRELLKHKSASDDASKLSINPDPFAEPGVSADQGC